MAKTLLVLGASREHVDLIRGLRAAQYRVVLADQDPDSPTHLRADLSVHTEEEKSLVDLCRREQVAGVIAGFSSGHGPLASCIAAAISTPFIPVAAARTLASRIRFREHLTELGFPHPQTHIVQSGAGLPAQLFKTNRWVIRPDVENGRGAALIADAASASATLSRMLAGGPGVLERQLLGMHALCAFVVRSKEILAEWFFDLDLRENLTTAGARVPCRLGQYPRKVVMQSLKQICESLSITDGMLLADVVLSENKPYILDLLPHLPGHGAIELARLSARVDLGAIAGAVATGEPLPAIPESDERAWASVLLSPGREGRLDFDVDAAEALSEQNWVSGLTWHAPRGTPIEEGSDLMREAGRAYVTGRDRDAVDARVTELLRKLKVAAMP